MTTREFQQKSALQIFLSYFRPHRRLFIMDLACALAISLIDLAFPYVSRWCMYELLPQSAYGAFFAVMDTIYQTECVSLVGKYFRSELEEASATYRFIQGLGSSLSSFVTPLFVTGDANASTQVQLTCEMGVAVLLAVVSYLLVCLFVKIYGKKRPN